jgi:hypothetical protein
MDLQGVIGNFDSYFAGFFAACAGNEIGKTSFNDCEKLDSYTADKPETSVDAFLANRRAESGE